MRPAVPGFLPFLLVFLLPGCAGGPAEITSISPGTPGFVMMRGRVSLPEGSHFPSNCGPETLCLALNYLGIPVTISEVERETYIPAIKGSVPPKIVEFARRQGVTAKVTERGGLWKLEEHVKAGSPMIIEVTKGGQYHFYFVAGLSREERAVVCAYYGDRQHLLPFEMLDELWRPTFYRSITFSVTQVDQCLEEGFDFLEGGRYELAEERFQKALGIQPECGPAFAGLGRIRIQQNRLAEAQDFLERAVKTMSSDPEVLNDLAHVILSRKGGDVARAARLSASSVEFKLKQIREFEDELKTAVPGTRQRVEEDLKKARENAFYLYGTLAQALEKNGLLKESIDARLESLKYPHLEEDDPDAPARRHLEIALTYRSMKAPDKAAEHFRKAMEAAKTEEFRGRIRKEKGE